MKFKGLYIFLLLCLAACGEEVIEQPENLIPEEKMTAILYDLAILNAADGTNPSVLEDRGIETMSFLYQKYEIDSAQFVDSDIYYASKPLQYQGMYERIEARIKKVKKQMEDERKRKTDSIKKAAEAKQSPVKTGQE
ncbi:DUF4296 domain-containing protein [Zeaxanthinibacter enoshimensis]|uniref:Uncharacterized protein DUF4296 n=1 Tax=Zeaxanthinibacter enoshimensis TaxID=392009 RepID=A0A4R6TNQ5_9FLAO|nr:DUF4296 domain-containing protein [Zeaxanthinibacter enoshimensis]TDQ33212.1 uncharacterized protein DUF4296 [Zeaxanthinibacter enoshimensis]